MIQVSVLTSAIISLLAILQKFTSLGLLIPQSDRVFSTIGNAGFLGTYLIFNIFLAGYLMISNIQPAFAGDSSVASLPQNDKKKSSHPERSEGSLAHARLKFIVYCFLLIVNCLALLFSGTRGAYLGLLAGIIVFSLLWATKNFYFLWKGEKNLTSQPPFKRGARGVKTLAIILLTIIIFIGLLFLARDSALVKNNPTLSRLTSISLSDTTTQSRLLIWQESWRAWQEKPLLGFGPENFEIAANKYFDARLAGYETYSFDRAHNFIFDYGVATGWLGLLGYLAMIGAAGWLLIRKIICHPERSEGSLTNVRPAFAGDSSLLDKLGAQNDKKESSYVEQNTGFQSFLFSTVFLSLLAAYLVQNFFIFDSFVSYLMLFFILALISSICHPERLVLRSFSEGGEKGSLNFVKKFFAFLFFVSCFLVIYWFNLKPLLASYRANQILSLPAADVAQSAPLLEDALALGSFGSAEVAYQAALDYIIKINQQPALAQNEEFYNIAASELSKIIERSPNRARNYVALAWLNLYFSNQHLDRINESISLAGKIIELSPTKKDAYLILVAGYSLSGQSSKAQEVISQALAIDGKMGEEVREYYEKLK